MKKLRAFCNLPWTRVKVQCEGTVSTCCHQTWRPLGNLFQNSFDEIWFGPMAQELRAETLAGRLHYNCQTQECPFRDKLPVNTEFETNDNGYPIELEFDLHASHCNFGGVTADPAATCIMCPRLTIPQDFLKNTDRTAELATKVMHLIPHIKKMCIMGLAEIFWKDKIFEMFDMFDFDRHKQNVLFWSNTNGSLCYPETMDRFAARTHQTVLHFSLDAATEETYLKIRKNKTWDRVLSNLRAWTNRKDPNHKVVIYNCINLLNIRELVQMVEMAHELKVDRIHFIGTNNMDGVNTLQNILPSPNNYQLFQTNLEAAKERASQLGVVLTLDRAVDGNMKDRLVKISLC